MKRKSLFFIAPQKVEIREEELAALGESEVRIETLCSAVSAGTELMIYRGEASVELATDETLPALSGKLGFPLRYGYCAVGRVVEAGQGAAGWIGKRVFAFNPHESAFNAKVTDLLPIPDEISDEDACFLPSAETAVNLILDGEPRLGEKVVVLGQGIVGLLVTALLSRHPLETLVAFDMFPLRREWSQKLGARSFDLSTIDQAQRILGPRRADLVYELTGNPDALNLALSLVGDDGRIVAGSWYGEKRAELDLGGRFHRGRIRLISSQVSHIEPALTGRWDRARRFEQAWKQIEDVRPSRLVTHRFPIEKAQAAYSQLLQNPADTLGVLFTYGTK